VVVSVVHNPLDVSDQRIGLAPDLLALHFAVLEVVVMGDSRILNVAEASRASIFKEANVGKLTDFVSVDSEAIELPFSAEEASAF